MNPVLAAPTPLVINTGSGGGGGGLTALFFLVSVVAFLVGFLKYYDMYTGIEIIDKEVTRTLRRTPKPSTTEEDEADAEADAEAEA